MANAQTNLQKVVKELETHLGALRDLDENSDRGVIVDHLYKLAAKADSAAEGLERDTNEAQKDTAEGDVKGVSEDLEETTDRNIEHVKEELEKPLEQLRENDDS